MNKRYFVLVGRRMSRVYTKKVAERLAGTMRDRGFEVSIHYYGISKPQKAYAASHNANLVDFKRRERS